MALVFSKRYLLQLALLIFVLSITSLPTGIKFKQDRKYRVPNIVHYIYGLENVSLVPFGLLQYISILGTLLYIRPDKILWHHKFVPDEKAIWWPCALPHLALTPAEPVREVHGRFMPNILQQHQSDITRFRILNESGGIYLDTDIIPLRSFGILRMHEFLMGKEGNAENALCNAVLIATPKARFLQRWWATYNSFDVNEWANHSVYIPALLQRQFPDECVALSNRAFFTPGGDMLDSLYTYDDGYDFQDNFAMHLWTSANADYRAHLIHLTIEDIFHGKGSFHRIARQVLIESFSAGLLCGRARAEMERVRHLYL